jgi:DNA-binding MarR family transcriptional regulator
LNTVEVVTKSEDLTAIERALHDLLRLIESVRVHESRMKAAGLRVSRTQLGFLGWLADNGPTPVSKLAEWADVSQPAASRALSQLEVDGYVERLADASDARVNLMSITPAGSQARQAVLRLMQAQLAAALGGMSAEQVHRLAGGLNELVAGLRNVSVEEHL